MRPTVKKRFDIRTRAGALIGVAASVILIAGCGSSSTKTGTVTAGAYVGQVCTSVASWLHNIQSQAGNLETRLGARPSPTTGKRALEEFISGALTDTESATSAMRGAGVPQVANGQKIATTLVAAFEHAQGTLKQLKSKTAALSTKNASVFSSEAKQIASSVQALPLTLGSGVAGLNSGELSKAASESSTCKSVGARGKS
jgi:hypothetical protein